MKIKVLMVCLGNICRSPLAHGLLESKTDSSKVFVDSAGTGNYHTGKKPDSRSIKVARKYGIDIMQQRCRQFRPNDFDNFDIIYVMDKSNYNNVLALAKTEEDIDKVKLILDEVDLGLTEVPDPYYDEDDGFENVFQMLEKACTNIAKKIES